MAYRANPFLERMSERRTSDQEFVQLFSPKIIEKLDENCLEGAVHIFRSPPGGGKTTILRAFTPTSLRAFWHAKPTQADSYRQLVQLGVLDEQDGPQMLGVMLSCASGYADLPPGASSASEGMFRALLDCRVVLRTLRSLAELIGTSINDGADAIKLTYSAVSEQLVTIPCGKSAAEMLQWAEQREREIYSRLDTFIGAEAGSTPVHVRFESVLWLQAVTFTYNNRVVAPRRLLMIDDIQRLRKSQRNLLIEEIVDLRPGIPVWLASRSIAFLNDFLIQGARDGRDLRDYPLEEIWDSGRNSQQFISFAQNILDRRFSLQTAVPGNSFGQYLMDTLAHEDLSGESAKEKKIFASQMQRHRSSIRYREWLAREDGKPEILTFEDLIGLFVTRILVARDEGSKQLSFELTPLSTVDLEERDSSAVKGAAEIFANYELNVPYYFGMERLCALSTNNIEELLNLAAALYDGMKAKQVIRRQAQPELLPREQERRLLEAAIKKRDFIPRGHSEGTYAQRMLDSIGVFCREKTFQINAPYAPGVTGIRLSHSEMRKLGSISRSKDELFSKLPRVVSECVAENLLVTRESKPTSSREGGTVFYLNRTLCAVHGLPLQFGGWQDVSLQKLTDWMANGYQPTRGLGLEVA